MNTEPGHYSIENSVGRSLWASNRHQPREQLIYARRGGLHGRPSWAAWKRWLVAARDACPFPQATMKAPLRAMACPRPVLVAFPLRLLHFHSHPPTTSERPPIPAPPPSPLRDMEPWPPRADTLAVGAMSRPLRRSGYTLHQGVGDTVGVPPRVGVGVTPSLMVRSSKVLRSTV